MEGKELDWMLVFAYGGVGFFLFIWWILMESRHVVSVTLVYAQRQSILNAKLIVTFPKKTHWSYIYLYYAVSSVEIVTLSLVSSMEIGKFVVSFCAFFFGGGGLTRSIEGESETDYYFFQKEHDHIYSSLDADFESLTRYLDILLAPVEASDCFFQFFFRKWMK